VDLLDPWRRAQIESNLFAILERQGDVALVLLVSHLERPMVLWLGGDRLASLEAWQLAQQLLGLILFDGIPAATCQHPAIASPLELDDLIVVHNLDCRDRIAVQRTQHGLLFE
jgi:nicotinic acid mononucleotide adenylyltransferase